MCMKDVRMGRVKTPQGSVNPVVPGSLTTPALAANANRAAAVFSLSADVIGDPGVTVGIRTGSGEGPTVGVLTAHNPMAVLTVEVFGRAVTGPLYLTQEFGTDPNVYASELVWLSDPEDA